MVAGFIEFRSLRLFNDLTIIVLVVFIIEEVVPPQEAKIRHQFLEINHFAFSHCSSNLVVESH